MQSNALPPIRWGVSAVLAAGTCATLHKAAASASWIMMHCSQYIINYDALAAVCSSAVYKI